MKNLIFVRPKSDYENVAKEKPSQYCKTCSLESKNSHKSAKVQSAVDAVKKRFSKYGKKLGRPKTKYMPLKEDTPPLASPPIYDEVTPPPPVIPPQIPLSGESFNSPNRAPIANLKTVDISLHSPDEPVAKLRGRTANEKPYVFPTRSKHVFEIKSLHAEIVD